jgi:hypothetical protein
MTPQTLARVLNAPSPTAFITQVRAAPGIVNDKATVIAKLKHSQNPSHHLAQ